MSSRELSKKWGVPGQGDVSEEDDGVASLDFTKNTSGRSDTSSLYSALKASQDCEARRCDDDSGVCNSSKATNSVGSITDNSDDEDRGGMFDYYPPQVKIRSGCGMSLDYDEAHEVKSDHSSQDVNSPRSDISDGIELTTFRSGGRRLGEESDDDYNFRRDRLKDQDDFNTDGESDDEHFKNYYNLGYRPLEKERPSFHPNFASLKRGETDYYRSSLRSEADDAISFPLNRYSRHTVSDSVKIETNSFPKRNPPFGHGLDQLQEVGKSITPLIPNIPSDKVKNMPEGRKLEALQPHEETKKKKKRKKLSRGKY